MNRYKIEVFIGGTRYDYKVDAYTVNVVGNSYVFYKGTNVVFASPVKHSIIMIID